MKIDRQFEGIYVRMDLVTDGFVLLRHLAARYPHYSLMRDCPCASPAWSDQGHVKKDSASLRWKAIGPDDRLIPNVLATDEAERFHFRTRDQAIDAWASHHITFFADLDEEAGS